MAQTEPFRSERPVGQLLREWRLRRRLSQLALACDAEISTRHLSFLETGRAAPSRAMVMRLAGHLQLPLREQNRLLGAAGFAPAYAERALNGPDLALARQAIDAILLAHEPNPALAVDGCWTLIAANRAAQALMAVAAADLLVPPLNMMRIALHPRGLAAHVRNYRVWREHLLTRLTRQAMQSGDERIAALLAEVRGYPAPSRQPGGAGQVGDNDISLLLELEIGGKALAFLSTVTVFGAPHDITLAEIALEMFFPADTTTAQFLAAQASGTTPDTSQARR